MKYMFLEYVSRDETYRNVCVSVSEDFSSQFPAEVGNTSYDQFLIQAELTDKKANALTPNVWYDFP